MLRYLTQKPKCSDHCLVFRPQPQYCGSHYNHCKSISVGTKHWLRVGLCNANGPEGQNYRSELHIFPASPGASLGGPEGAHPAAAPAGCVPGSSALAPGYAEPLKGVPPEKFNHTTIPKGYRCPWQEFVSYRDYQIDGRSHTPSPNDYRNFNKTPVPFGGPLVGGTFPRPGTPFIPEPLSGLELRLRPSFNRVAQGWVRNLPESEEL
ncbi:myozenin-3-like [Symphalangus syndactylus]|uniref:myozenin-3-like n=1 Tax=Symphalangus syndactylus TaxID=9590 RepID=UPI00300627CE